MISTLNDTGIVTDVYRTYLALTSKLAWFELTSAPLQVDSSDTAFPTFSTPFYPTLTVKPIIGGITCTQNWKQESMMPWS